MVVIGGNDESRLEPKRFSSWLRLTIIQAWIYRFVNNCLLPSDRRAKDELIFEEIQDAEIRMIKAAQKRSFKAEYSALSSGKPLPMFSKLLTLKPRLYEDGVMRSDGRLENAEYSVTIQRQVSHNIAKKRVGNETESKVVSSARKSHSNQTLEMLS